MSAFVMLLQQTWQAMSLRDFSPFQLPEKKSNFRFVQTGAMTCPRCGARTSRLSEACSKCGFIFNDKREEAPLAKPRRRGSPVVVLLCLGTIGGSAWRIWDHKRSIDLENAQSDAQNRRSALAQQLEDEFTATLQSAPVSSRQGTLAPLLALRPQFAGKVPPSVRAQIEPRYDEWKAAHAENASQVPHLLSLYAPDALVFQTPQAQISVKQLGDLATLVRQGGSFSRITDEIEPTWRQNPDGSRVEIVSKHFYGAQKGGGQIGFRRLTWARQNNQWLIVRDDLPPSYSPFLSR
jgi:ribosomal protein L37E